MSYSIDVLKKSAFLHEIMNNLETTPLSERDQEWMIVKEYLDKRIKALDDATKR
jgi:hypothetical protein